MIRTRMDVISGMISDATRNLNPLLSLLVFYMDAFSYLCISILTNPLCDHFSSRLTISNDHTSSIPFVVNLNKEGSFITYEYQVCGQCMKGVVER